ncbi:hypothetical protein [Chitinophaga filiformis]|uniref:Uncharacterized protein n=1 Tax=Chitinophaga filiformis TaxID=104663 RepID=A0A1G7ZWF7_CHIFI|nr:hypothetical protein [Chitinophaga filiformis]SDH12986.1 hypothetical protein SAMN04488121_10922 [Chitinophaga filiformis]
MEDEKVEEKIRCLIEQARTTGKPTKRRRLVSGIPSLFQIIKTKEQADEFMEMLNRVFNKVP